MTVHQEFRVLRRILSVAVKQKRLNNNPCAAVEFPVSVGKTTRKPHYMTTTEQKRIERFAPKHLKNVIVIISETGLRPYKELMPIKKSQVDLENSLVHIPDSKTPSGIGDMPMTKLAAKHSNGNWPGQRVRSTSSQHLERSPKNPISLR